MTPASYPHGEKALKHLLSAIKDSWSYEEIRMISALIKLTLQSVYLYIRQQYRSRPRVLAPSQGILLIMKIGARSGAAAAVPSPIL